MAKIPTLKINEFVEKNIQAFHEKRLKNLEKLKLETVLKKKNPYLFRAKNILLAEEFVKTITDAFLSSQEEALFGSFLEDLAIFVCEKVLNGRKASSEGIDLEFEKNETTYLVAVKSGPNWGNSQQILRMEDNFRKAKRILRTGKGSRSGNIIAVNGCCYGKEPSPDKGDYFKYCGQEFWALISGDKDFYTKIIEPLGHKAKEKNEDFAAGYAKRINKFAAEFLEKFCVKGKIDWKQLVQFNSGKG